jgi:hypothetical protein
VDIATDINMSDQPDSEEYNEMMANQPEEGGMDGPEGFDETMMDGMPPGMEGMEGFMPTPSDYLIRQQQFATFQMLCQFLTKDDKNITDVLNDIRVSLDCLTKCVMQLNKNVETMASNQKPTVSKK